MKYHTSMKDEPTLFNKDAALGALIGGFIGPIGLVAGTVIGAYIGKKRMEKESVEGKVVKEPTTLSTLFSRDAAIDGWIGKFGGLVAGIAIAALVTGTFLPSAGIGLAIVKLCAVGGTLLGAFKGASSAKEKMEREYRDAQQASISPISTRKLPSREQATGMEEERTGIQSFTAEEEKRRAVNASMTQQGISR